MTATRIDIPDEPQRSGRHNKKQHKEPGWVVIALVAAVALSLGGILTYSGIESRNDADVSSSQALSLAQQIQEACVTGGIPAQYADLCSQASETEQVVQAVKGPEGPEGDRGARGLRGIPGVPGAPGLDGSDGSDGRDGVDGQDGAAGADGESVAGSDGADGADGARGADGAPGKPGAPGQPPVSWATDRADGTTERCTRVADFDPANPRYGCITVSTPVVPTS